MGDPNPKGTENNDENFDSSWYIVQQAECVDSVDTLNELFEESSDGSIISNLIDDDEVDQGNSLALYHAQCTEECNSAITALKRKYHKSPEQAVADLSPQLQAVKITPEKERNIKRKLFQDSGVFEDEAENSFTQVESQTSNQTANTESTAIVNDLNLELLQSSNSRAIMLAKFKEWFGVAYTEITRSYRSDKTCNDCWVVAIFKAAEEVLEGSKVLLTQHCNYVFVKVYCFHALYLLHFKASKSRETVSKLMCSLLGIQPFQFLADPPRSRSMATALYFYKSAINNTAYTVGTLPDWIVRQTQVNHQVATAESFDFADMVQWAYDNNFVEECDIAYHFACYADENANAAAYLRTNNQVTHVKNCSIMVKHYKRYEMKEMSMSAWIYKCCNECTEEADWKPISQFLKYQDVNILALLIALKNFLKGIPKKNSIVFYGPPDTGKSMFCFSFIKFLRGTVVSYVNRGSHFWLQPLRDAKIGYMDDVTYVAWLYIDQNLRNALDGNVMSLDAKHKTPIQMKLPPLLFTTNIDVQQDQSLKYLHSRLQCFQFPNTMPCTENGTPLYKFTDANWKSFFSKLGSQLELSREDGVPNQSFRCSARSNSESH